MNQGERSEESTPPTTPSQTLNLRQIDEIRPNGAALSNRTGYAIIVDGALTEVNQESEEGASTSSTHSSLRSNRTFEGTQHENAAIVVGTKNNNESDTLVSNFVDAESQDNEASQNLTSPHQVSESMSFSSHFTTSNNVSATSESNDDFVILAIHNGSVSSNGIDTISSNNVGSNSSNFSHISNYSYDNYHEQEQNYELNHEIGHDDNQGVTINLSMSRYYSTASLLPAFRVVGIGMFIMSTVSLIILWHFVRKRRIQREKEEKCREDNLGLLLSSEGVDAILTKTSCDTTIPKMNPEQPHKNHDKWSKPSSLQTGMEREKARLE